jgi:hypothetical protein
MMEGFAYCSVRYNVIILGITGNYIGQLCLCQAMCDYYTGTDVSAAGQRYEERMAVWFANQFT